MRSLLTKDPRPQPVLDVMARLRRIFWCVSHEDLIVRKLADSHPGASVGAAEVTTEQVVQTVLALAEALSEVTGRAKGQKWAPATPVTRDNFVVQPSMNAAIASGKLKRKVQAAIKTVGSGAENVSQSAMKASLEKQGLKTLSLRRAAASSRAPRSSVDIS